MPFGRLSNACVVICFHKTAEQRCLGLIFPQVVSDYLISRVSFSIPSSYFRRPNEPNMGRALPPSFWQRSCVRNGPETSKRHEVQIFNFLCFPI